MEKEIARKALRGVLKYSFDLFGMSQAQNSYMPYTFILFKLLRYIQVLIFFFEATLLFTTFQMAQYGNRLRQLWCYPFTFLWSLTILPIRLYNDKNTTFQWERKNKCFNTCRYKVTKVKAINNLEALPETSFKIRITTVIKIV